MDWQWTVERVREQEVERALGREAERDQARDAAADRGVAPDQERVATQEVGREPLAVRAPVRGAGAASLLARAAEPVGHRDQAREPGREKDRAVVAVDPAQALVAGRVQGAARAPVPARARHGKTNRLGQWNGFWLRQRVRFRQREWFQSLRHDFVDVDRRCQLLVFAAGQLWQLSLRLSLRTACATG